ncbi:hypothetical protein MSM1_20090 [Mycobacterium sp. SM1]|uniref:hypothetical protein n=1 Tax=Mycobacterium sp. SM1 TaxID=2816243 RepID=UPI001BCE94F8|nr:hypothetical protein [Mycobacterium sp. SM1]MBS4730523.1 hypothetical protein [Mycobacterium sp. SM1]
MNSFIRSYSRDRIIEIELSSQPAPRHRAARNRSLPVGAVAVVGEAAFAVGLDSRWDRITTEEFREAIDNYGHRMRGPAGHRRWMRDPAADG